MTGTVLKVDNRCALVDVGGKSPAIVPVAEMSVGPVSDASSVLPPGTVREFIVVGNTQNMEPILSVKKIELAIIWERLRQMQAEDATVEGLVFGANRGGLMVDVQGVRGFVPVSQLGSKYVKDDMAGETLALKIIEADEANQKFVLSNRRAEPEEEVVLRELEAGEVVEGRVTAVKPYGAFVDLGGVSGLLHISQISAERIANINNVVATGDRLKVMVLSLDREKNRYAVSTKKLEPSPGDFIRNPQEVYDRAEEMAAIFKERLSAATEAEQA